MAPDEPILLILDLDETLVHAVEGPAGPGHDFAVGPYAVSRRPGLDEFLAACSARFRLAVWSSATDDYVRAIVARIWPEGMDLAFAWGRGRCVRRFDPETYEDEFLKDLKKVERAGYPLSRVLIVDDSPRKVRRNYGNAVYVPPFEGDPADRALPTLARYLATLRDAADVRRLEKRGWWSRGLDDPGTIGTPLS